MQKQHLFLETLEDLRTKINSNNPYHIIKSSELIRTLLFDPSGPLVDKINREFKIKLTFEYKDGRKSLQGFREIGLPLPTTFMIADGFYPKTAIANKKNFVDSKRDEFFQALLIYHNENEITVKNILDHALYFLGGTHHDNPKKEEELILSKLNDELLIGGHSSIVYPIKAVGLVVLESLKKLENSVKDKYCS